MEKIFKLDVKGLANAEKITWIKLSSITDLQENSRVLVYDTDNELIRGAKIIKIENKSNKIKIEFLFRID